MAVAGRAPERGVPEATLNNKPIECRVALLVVPALVAGIYRDTVLVQIPVTSTAMTAEGTPT